MVKVDLQTALEQIKSSTKLPEIYKSQLDKCPITDLRPAALMQWARKTFAIGRENGVPDNEIVSNVKAYAMEGNWSERQTYKVIEANDATTYERYSGGKSVQKTVYLSLGTFKKIAMHFSGLDDERDMIQQEHSPQRIVRLSDSRLREWTSGMSDVDLQEMPKYIKIVIAQFEEALKMIDREKITRAKYGR